MCLCFISLQRVFEWVGRPEGIPPDHPLTSTGRATKPNISLQQTNPHTTARRTNFRSPQSGTRKGLGPLYLSDVGKTTLCYHFSVGL